MFDVDSTHPKTFDEWLAIAARGLCEHSVECVREDLHEQFGGREINMRELYNLGNPVMMRLKLRLVYLTQKEENWLRKTWRLDPDGEKKEAKQVSYKQIGIAVAIGLAAVLLLLGVWAVTKTDISVLFSAAIFGIAAVLVILVVFSAIRKNKEKAKKLPDRPKHGPIKHLRGMMWQGVLGMASALSISARDVIKNDVGTGQIIYILFVLLGATAAMSWPAYMLFKLKLRKRNNMSPTMREILEMYEDAPVQLQEE